jgi:carboxyl-terminal processing protease
VAHIKLLKFGGETDAEWEVAVSEILKRPEVEGIVLDVRNNPGGYLQGAVDIAGEFLRTGKVVVIEERAGAKEEYIVETVGRFLNTPLVVLVNEGSASASEILAGAISDNKRGKIVGEVTFGKGTIQEPQQVNGGAGLHITIARWLTPKETWVNDEGLKPDVEVEDDPNTESDEQLQEAIKQLGF